MKKKEQIGTILWKDHKIEREEEEDYDYQYLSFKTKKTLISLIF